MKSYRALKEQISAALPRTRTGGSAKTGPTSSDIDINLHSTEDPEVVDRVNAALAYMNRTPTANPQQRVSEIKVALSHAGVDFDHTLVEVSEDETSDIPVSRWGGRIGQDEDGTWINDDGFSHKGSSYALRFEWNKTDGLWDLNAKLVSKGPVEESYE